MDRVVRYTTLGLVVLMAVLATATAAGFLDRVSWVFEIATLFRLQYAVVLLVAGVLALALRRPRLAVAGLVLAAVNIAVIAPWQGASYATASTGNRTLRIVSFNVEAGNHRYDELAPLVARLRPDILGLMELTPAWARAAEHASARVRPRQLVPQPGAYGMGLLSDLTPTAVRVRHFPADGPTALVARFKIQHFPVTFVLVHVHTPFAGSVHARELSALAAARPTLGSRLIVCGDFNTVPWSAQFEDFGHDAGLTDVFQGTWHTHSWPSWSPLLGALIDHCLISGGLTVRDRSFGPSSGSDHLPLVLDVSIERKSA
jgi:endonuclease/exonuclease/phosphatase (EEP) superfamily protein YafD